MSKDIFHGKDFAVKIWPSQLLGPEKNNKLIMDMEHGDITLYAFKNDTYETRFYGIFDIMKSMLEKSNIGRKINLPERLYIILYILVSTILYICNSTSFRDGKLHKFDEDEIRKKLKRI